MIENELGMNPSKLHYVKFLYIVECWL